MRLFRISLAAVAVMLLHCSCQKQDVSLMPQFQDEMVTVEDGSKVRSSSLEQGHLRIQLSDEMTELAENDHDAFLELFSSLGVKSAERTFPDAGKFEARTRAEGMHRWYDLYFDEEIPLTKAGEELSLIDNLGYVEYRPRVVRITSQDVSWRSGSASSASNHVERMGSNTFFNDPLLEKQWHYLNDGSKYGTRSGCDVNVVPVWRNKTTGSPDVVVSVVDGGIDFRHEDLAGNMWHNPERTGEYIYGYNFVRNNYQVEPENHGTHVAGTIAAVNNNGLGVSGIAGGDLVKGRPGVKLMSCQIFVSDNDDISGDGSTAIKWGADHGAIISQNSWGYKDERTTVPKSDKDAIDYFNKYAGVDENGNQTGLMKGGVVIFAAGNENRDFGAPAAYEGCVAVSALAANYRRASYSNFGDWVDIAAPGGDVETGPSVLSTLTNNSYGNYQGTSMACPHVSGVAALIVSAVGGPGFTRDMLIDRLLKNTTDLSKYGVKDVGNLVNAYAAIAGSSTVAPDQVTSVELSVSSNVIHFKVKIPKDQDDGSPYGITAYYDTLAFRSLETVEQQNFEIGNLVAGDYLEGDIMDLKFDKKYFVGFDAYDLSSNHGAISTLKQITTGHNAKPVIECDVPTEHVEVRTFETKVFNISYYDPDGHELSTRFEDNGAASLHETGKPGQCRIQINGKGAPAGSYEFKLVVSDKYGAADSLVVPYVIKPNTPPEKLKDIDNMVFGAQNETLTLNLADYFHDEDGEPLSVKCTVSDNNVVNLSPTSKFTLIVTALMYGTADVTVSVSDAMEKTVSTSFKVLVRDASQPFDIYPNPVTDGMLFVRSGDSNSTKIVVSSASGAIVYDSTVTTDAFNPAAIDMSGCSSGVYSVRVSNSSATITTSIVNIHND
ncbi:MAG: S8 family serine peptidase [Bacteroidales bacterium]|nr:S8 family serine peptidase [Bacteroidales bacterium]